jgi:hypothetical protein
MGRLQTSLAQSNRITRPNTSTQQHQNESEAMIKTIETPHTEFEAMKEAGQILAMSDFENWPFEAKVDYSDMLFCSASEAGQNFDFKQLADIWKEADDKGLYSKETGWFHKTPEGEQVLRDVYPECFPEEIQTAA